MPEGMHPKAMAGLKKWSKGKKLSEVADSIERNTDVDEPYALAAWIKQKEMGKKKYAKTCL